MKINVNHVAKLANLPLNPEEEKKFELQLEETLSYIQNLEEIDTKNVKPTSQVTGLENVFREDEVEPSLSQKEALQNAQKTQNGFIVVPAVLDE